jgi:hypothetical protein
MVKQLIFWNEESILKKNLEHTLLTKYLYTLTFVNTSTHVLNLWAPLRKVNIEIDEITTDLPILAYTASQWGLIITLLMVPVSSLPSKCELFRDYVAIWFEKLISVEHSAYLLLPLFLNIRCFSFVKLIYLDVF